MGIHHSASYKKRFCALPLIRSNLPTRNSKCIALVETVSRLLYCCFATRSRSERLRIGPEPPTMESRSLGQSYPVQTNYVMPSAESTDLPSRTPNSQHLRFFRGCAPFTSLRRSLSAPRNTSGASTLLRSTPAEPPPSPKVPEPPSIPTFSESHQSDNWQKDGSFGWKRVRSGASFRQKFLHRTKHHDPRDAYEEGSRTSIIPECCASPSVGSPSSFHDPLLEELDNELPVPPPPPRAQPPWLKLAFTKQKLASLQSSTQSCDFSPSFHTLSKSNKTTSNEILEGKKALSLEHNRFNVRIYPVMQNGVKVSDTHYWLLEPPRSQSMRHHNEPFSKRRDDSSSEYLNVPSGVHLRRGASEPSRDALNRVHHELVMHLMEQVPSATQAECQAVLIGCSYQFEKAVQRLKLELMYRKGYVSRAHCKRLLMKFNWDLNAAISSARLEYEIRNMHKQGRVRSSPEDPYPVTEAPLVDESKESDNEEREFPMPSFSPPDQFCEGRPSPLSDISLFHTEAEKH
ncbi:unnamed protein product [Calicophoron daubneyi]|uniref:Uncharacterized protein n=1 Tax=Calicophoron daubneyi TaxID=300641 RepID=A0AAV2T9P1_CALDB